MKILVIDGRLMSRKVVVYALRYRGYTVEEHADYTLYNAPDDIQLVLVNCQCVTPPIIALCGRLIHQNKAVVLIARSQMSRTEEARLDKSKLFEFKVHAPSVTTDEIVGLVSVTIANTRLPRLGLAE